MSRNPAGVRFKTKGSLRASHSGAPCSGAADTGHMGLGGGAGQVHRAKIRLCFLNLHQHQLRRSLGLKVLSSWARSEVSQVFSLPRAPWSCGVGPGGPLALGAVLPGKLMCCSQPACTLSRIAPPGTWQGTGMFLSFGQWAVDLPVAT